MTSIAGLTVLFDFEPGSRIGTARTNGFIPAVTDWVYFNKGEQCEVIEDTVYRLSAGRYRFRVAGPNTQYTVVHEAGGRVPSTKPVPRSEGREYYWPDSGYKGLTKPSWAAGEFVEAVKWAGSMQSPVPTQAILMDEFAKEAQDDARYNAVPSSFISSKIERF